MSTETLSIRLDTETKDRLDQLAARTRRTKSFLAGEAVRAYLQDQEWQLQQIEAGIADLDSGRAIPHEEVVAWLQTWSKKPAPRKRS